MQIGRICKSASKINAAPFPSSPLSHQRLGSWKHAEAMCYYQLQLSLRYQSTKSTHSWWCKFTTRMERKHWNIKHPETIPIINYTHLVVFPSPCEVAFKLCQWPPQLLQWKTMRGLGMCLPKFHIQSFWIPKKELAHSRPHPALYSTSEGLGTKWRKHLGHSTNSTTLIC